jgi:hypothetical protein
MRPLAICTADFPDDSVETEDGQGFLDYGGRTVAAALAETLSRLGCSVSPLENADIHGWRFNWSFKRQDFCCQVSSIPPEFYLLFDNSAAFEDLSSKHRAARAEIMTALAAELVRDGRFHDILWYPRLRGVVRLDQGYGSADPLAPAPRERGRPIASPDRNSRPMIFLVGWVGLLATVGWVALRASAIGFATLGVSVMLVLIGSGVIKNRWLRLLGMPAANDDENASK